MQDVPRLEREDELTRLFAGDVLIAAAHGPLLRPPDAPAASRTVSRFLYLRPRAGVLAAQAPGMPAAVVLHHPAAVALVSGAPAELPPAVHEALLRLLGAAGLLDEADAAAEGWTFADRIAYFDEREDQPPQRVAPPFKPAMGPRLALPASDAPLSMPLGEALLRRRSRYDRAAQPVGLQALGALLDAAARSRGLVEGYFYQSSRRPYASGGAVYPIEIYLLAARVDGLTSGFYHYAPEAHALEAVVMHPADQAALCRNALLSTGEQASEVQALLLFTARLERMRWKHLSLTLALQDCGGLLATLYLAATALALAPCALGGIDARAFAQASGLAQSEEPLVSAFLVGSAPAEFTP
jgi:SagB-type dehydrogenase family enzyme